MNLRAVEALWYEPGTIYDAAHAINAKRPHVKWVSPVWVRDKWAQAQKDGRLPPFERPANGFNIDQSVILKRFMMIEREKRAA